MEETPEERLNRLQLADLGTARREYISTVGGFRETRVQVIEATRKSNMTGTKEQRIANQNKTQLAGWANMYKTVEDTGGLEELDDLLNGQTHRLSLSESLHPSGAPGQGRPGGNGGNSRPQITPFIHGASSRSVSTISGILRPSQSRKQSGRFPQPGFSPPKSGGSRLDPALECNNVGKNATVTTKRVSSAHNAPNPMLKTRRPLPTSQTNVVSPEDFLAEARRLRAPKLSNGQPPTEKPTTSGPAAAKNPPTAKTPTKTANAQASRVLRSLPQKPTMRHTSSLPDNNVKAKEKLSARSAEKDSADEAARAFLNTVGRQEKPHTKAQDTAVKAKGSDPVPPIAPQKNVGMLLDLDFSTETETEANKSPAFKDLQGLDFEQNPLPQSSEQPPIAVAHSDVDLDENLPEEKRIISGSVNITITTDTVDEETATEYQREIDIICSLLEHTSLSEPFESKLTELKQELESRLQRRHISQIDNQSAAVVPIQEEPQVVFSSPKKAKAVAPDAIKETPKRGYSRTESSVSRESTPSSISRLIATAPQFTPKASFNEYRSSSNATSTDSSTVFHPAPLKGSPQPESALSDATVVTAREDKPSPEPLPEPTWTEFTPSAQRSVSGNHIFGDHLLPGGRARRPAEIKKPVEIKRPDGTHLFGDHNLPGRGPKSQSNLTVSAKSESVLTQAAAPKPLPTAFSFSFKPQTLFTTSSNAPVFGAKSQENSPLKPSAPAYQPESKSILSARPTDVAPSVAAAKPAAKPAQKSTSMMQSIYAPQPQGASTSTAPAKKSSNQGLMASRYSNPQWI